MRGGGRGLVGPAGAHEVGGGESDLYARRRARVLEALGDDGAMVLPASPELLVGRDLELRYQPDPDLYYLTGYTEPEAVAVLCPAHEEAPFTLFVRPRDPALELWTGPRGGPEAAREEFGADAAHPIGEIEARLPTILSRANRVHFRFGTGRDALETLVRGILVRARKTRPRTGRGPNALIDPGTILDPMRLIKDEDELALLRRAAEITVEGFLDAARVIRPGAGEWEVEAAVEAAFRRRGADGVAFPTIAAAGRNATVLHYVDNRARLAAGELLLLDAGARYRRYCGDVTRTFPVDGRFTREQRALYDVVLAARDAAIHAVRPAATIADVHLAALRTLLAGLVELGLLSGSPEAIERREADYKPFFPHRTSHWLGLDVHDVGDYANGEASRSLEPGMVLTIEPALYVPADREDAPAALRGVGIRIEDDVVVTADGHEVMTAALPAEAEAVEAMVAGARVD